MPEIDVSVSWQLIKLAMYKGGESYARNRRFNIMVVKQTCNV